ncbi:MAG TPA: UvrD-helicase domain-containing protein [Fimbriimonadaceae bacterium]|nr:UvrD-helicase domain-containing protein [Fimbriimonadaceae bacterium]
MSKFTPEQVAIIEEQENHFVILASAGAGKTRMLVERYLRHVIDDGLSPAQILTITFTKKAAADMKRRIVLLLRGAGRTLDAQAAETGPIQTIDSFCRRLLVENAVEAGVDPDFAMIEDETGVRLFDLALRQAIACETEESAEAQALLAHLVAKPRSAQSQWFSALADDIRTILGRLRGTLLTPDQLAPIYASAESVRAHARQEVWRRLPPALQTRAMPEEESGIEFVKSTVKLAREAGTQTPRWLRCDDASGADYRYACGLMQIALETWRRWEQLMHQEQRFDFNAVESLAIRLIEGSPQARARTQRQFRVVLVDEFQDVNPTQKRLIDALEIGRTLKVGDPQQSIYGFRQADPRLFEREVEEKPTRILSKNHRSDPGILRFVDHLFGRMHGDAYRPMLHEDVDLTSDAFATYDGIEYWRQQPKQHAETAHRLLGLHREGMAWSDIAVLVRRSESAQSLVPHLHRLGIPHRVAGGVESIYVRMEVRDLANALTALVNPRDDFALLAMLRSPIVGLSLDAIALLAAARPAIEGLHGLESPIEEDGPKIASFLAWFRPLSAFADRLTAWELIAEVLRHSPLLPTLAGRPDGLQTIANVRRLLEIAANQPEIDAIGFAEQIRELQVLKRHGESTAPSLDDKVDAVKIMTIHKAKGLEFPCVVLTDLNDDILRKPKETLVDPDTGLVATKYTTSSTEIYGMFRERSQEKNREEELRLLYVAMTRAEKRLCLVLGTPTKESGAKLILGHMGEAPPGVRLRELTPYLQVSN